ncbi:uncharacterized protein LOC127833425 [Dreissena polymorpha]|uniref:Uncharacterized protein n=2 Tax=Dreissena polymorpha TaxID=45954 RepID=A0A9D4JES1_DREPO|nr:uncharacterized protein LOC127833425 [Dreissena polymorpha]KAH3809150.1 hypothetical protein DPMN_137513 [Dreissena polymorpha]
MATLAESNFHGHHTHRLHHYDNGDDVTETDDVKDMSSTLTLQTGFGSMSQSRLNLHNEKMRMHSSFPNLLSIYQTPIEEEDGDRPRRRVKGKHKKLTKQTQDGEEHHDNRQRNEMRQLRMEAVAREQLERFDDYVKRLRSKVDKQREERRKYNEALQGRLREQEEVEKKKLRLHRGPKHVYVHDKSYVKTLPVSNYCKATRLADELQRKGVLRTRQDVEKYWSSYGNSRILNQDIFSENSNNSVNYTHNWIGERLPKIRVGDDDDNDDVALTDELVHNRKKQLPPIKKTKT